MRFWLSTCGCVLLLTAWLLALRVRMAHLDQDALPLIGENWIEWVAVGVLILAALVCFVLVKLEKKNGD
jgi:hypothetical protein